MPAAPPKPPAPPKTPAQLAEEAAKAELDAAQAGAKAKMAAAMAGMVGAGPLAARIGDMHICPMVTPGTPPVPHVGGPVLPPGCPTVLIGMMPAARVGDMLTCVGPPDAIVKGSLSVMIGGQPAARMGDMTTHGGVISVGCPTVMIGDAGSPAGGAPSSLQAQALVAAAKARYPFCKKCQEAAIARGSI